MYPHVRSLHHIFQGWCLTSELYLDKVYLKLSTRAVAGHVTCLEHLIHPNLTPSALVHLTELKNTTGRVESTYVHFKALT